MWEKVNLMSSIPAVKTTNRPISAGRNFVSLSSLVNGQYFKDYLKILGTLGLDHGSFTQWIHIVKWIVPFVKRIADWSVQKARSEAVRRGEKIQFDGFYLTRSLYLTAPALPSTMRRLAKLYCVFCLRMYLRTLANNA